MERVKKICFLSAFVVFSSVSLSLFSFEGKNNKEKKTSLEQKGSLNSVEVDIGGITYIRENILLTENTKDPYKILRSWVVIIKNPEKVADVFLKLTSSMNDDEKKRLIDQYSGHLSLLLDRLDMKKSDKFQPVLEIVVNSGVVIKPDIFENFKPIAEEIMKRYVEEYNKNVRRMPPEKRIVEISTTTLNYDTALNRLIEFSKKIRASPHSSIPLAESISNRFSTNTSVQNALSYLFLENSNYQEAEKYASKSIDIDSNNFDAYLIRSQARFSLKDVKGAIEDIKKASEIDPSDETARLIATYLERQSHFNTSKISALKDSFAENIEAENSIFPALKSNVLQSTDTFYQNDEKSINDNDKKAAYYLKIAQVKTEMKDYSDALKYINKAIEKNPSNLDFYIERANIHNLMGNYTDAIADATFVLRHDPNNIFALNIRAWALYRQGEIDRAYDDTSKAIYIKPNFADAMFLRALIYERQSKYDEMLKDLEKASRLNPAYTASFKDAVAAYSYRAPDFMNYYYRNKDIFTDIKSDDKSRFNIKRFSVLLLLTIIGGVLIGISLLHIFSPKITHSNTSSSSLSASDTITPSIFYEGVASGKYKIIKKIGQGGMGSVYLAIDQSLNREVAIKKMNEEIKMNEREKQRFLEEARTVAMLHHPNIIEIYTIFEEKGDLYLVFEYIDGTSLDNKLNEAVRMPFFEVKPIVIDIAKALKYAHSRNVIHRDLKLSNIMISKDGIVKVTDFGLAKVVREARARYSSTEIVGSPAYMAPEQDNGIFLKESDLYSLGICIYELLVGELPFSGPDYHYQKERKLYTPLSQIVVGLPKDIDRVISKLLEPDPTYRYRSVDDFLKDFENLS